MRAERKNLNKSQAQLAKLLKDNGFSAAHPSTVAKVEAGDRAVSLDELAAYSAVFNVSMSKLLGQPARPRGDLLYAVRGAEDAKEQAHWSVSSAERMLGEAASELADADPDGRYAPLVDDLLNARKALGATGQIVASIGRNTNPAAAAAIREGTKAMMRQWLAEQETGE